VSIISGLSKSTNFCFASELLPATVTKNLFLFGLFILSARELEDVGQANTSIVFSPIFSKSSSLAVLAQFLVSSEFFESFIFALDAHFVHETMIASLLIYGDNCFIVEISQSNLSNSADIQSILCHIITMIAFLISLGLQVRVNFIFHRFFLNSHQISG